MTKSKRHYLRTFINNLFFIISRTTAASQLENSSISNNTVLKNVKLLYKFLIEKKKNKLTVEICYFFQFHFFLQQFNLWLQLNITDKSSYMLYCLVGVGFYNYTAKMSFILHIWY